MPKILWIEDEARDQFIEYLAPLVRSGYMVELVEDASEAYKRLYESKYDVVIFDLLLKSGTDFLLESKYPGLDLLIKLFKNNSNPPDIGKDHVIVFTVVTNPEIIHQITQLGIKNIKAKKQMHRTMLKQFVDEILAQKKNGRER